VSITHRFGVLIGLSSGEYSDYSFNGLYRVLKDLHLPTLAQDYHDSLKPNKWGQKDVSATGFGSWLIRGGYVEEVAYDEVHLDYFTFSETASECKDLE